MLRITAVSVYALFWAFSTLLSVEDEQDNYGILSNHRPVEKQDMPYKRANRKCLKNSQAIPSCRNSSKVY